jgi:hypothetical protein
LPTPTPTTRHEKNQSTACQDLVFTELRYASSRWSIVSTAPIPLL